MSGEDLTRARWRKSTRSGGQGDCVEVADLEPVTGTPGIGVRDSKDKTGPVLRFTPSEWVAFLEGAKIGEFDI